MAFLGEVQSVACSELSKRTLTVPLAPVTSSTLPDLSAGSRGERQHPTTEWLAN